MRKKNICKNISCNETARYGVVNPETGMFEKHHCKIHKIKGEKGKPPKWEFRYNDVDKITSIRNVKLLESKLDYIQKTKINGCDSFLNLQCLECGKIVTTTTIDSFVNMGKLGCLCYKSELLCEKYEFILENCKKNNIKLLDSEAVYIKKTTKHGCNTYLNLQCNICLDIVNTTSIEKFIKGQLGCSCNKIIPYYNKYSEFLEICENRNINLLDTEEEFLEKTKGKNCVKVFLNLKCNICNTIVTTTSINNFINGNHLDCKCSIRLSEKFLGEILKDIFPDNQFIKIKPDWIKNQAGNNLELDYYNEELKLAYEYQGLQHEEYNKFFHRGDINNFYKQQEHDRIKKEVCEENGIKLICIPSKYDYTNPLEMCDFVLENL